MSFPFGALRPIFRWELLVSGSVFTDLCWDLNSHCFPMVGMVINPIVGVYIPIIRIPTNGGITIPNIATFDHGTFVFYLNPW